MSRGPNPNASGEALLSANLREASVNASGHPDANLHQGRSNEFVDRDQAIAQRVETPSANLREGRSNGPATLLDANLHQASARSRPNLDANLHRSAPREPGAEAHTLASIGARVGKATDRDRDHDRDLLAHAKRYIADPAYAKHVRARVMRMLPLVAALARVDALECALSREIDRRPR